MTTARKRRPEHGKSKKPSKRPKPDPMSSEERKKPSRKMLKLFRKRARDYHSDEEDEEEPEPMDQEAPAAASSEDDVEEEAEASEEDESSGSEDEGDGAQEGITRFAEGCRAFRVVFLKIMKKNLPSDPLGPILSAHKKLVAEKLAEEAGQKVKGERKEKRLAGERGHVKPDKMLNNKEKELIRVAKSAVVKLFNAVSRAKNPQKGLNPSKSKDAKELAKRRKEVFLSELQKSKTQADGNPSAFNTAKYPESTTHDNNEEPGWAPLRDSYMLTSSKLKDWDKMEDAASVEPKRVPMDSSSDEE